MHGKWCRRIAAVEYMLLRDAKPSSRGEMIIKGAELECTKRKSRECVKNGKGGECKAGERQRFKCRGRSRRFGDNLGFGRRRTARRSPPWRSCWTARK